VVGSEGGCLGVWKACRTFTDDTGKFDIFAPSLAL
jgi:hypothetical protein